MVGYLYFTLTKFKIMKNLFNFWGFFRRNSITVEPRMSQLQTVMMHLRRRGSITTWQAITEYHITRLSAIIYRLRNEQGMDITSMPLTTITKEGKIKRVTVYTYTQN